MCIAAVYYSLDAVLKVLLILQALLSILERCGDQNQLGSSRTGSSSIDLPIPGLPPVTPDPAVSKGTGKKSGVGGRVDPTPTTSTPVWRSESRSSTAPTWLSMSMDAALGCRASIFQIQRTQQTGKRTSSAALPTAVNIHPQASALVCR